MTFIADTGTIDACHDRSDQHHAVARTFPGAFNEELRLPALVLAESDHLVGVRLGENARAAVIADVLDTVTVMPFDQGVAVRAADVVVHYRKFPLGLTDATLIVHAQGYRTLDPFTVDQRR